MPVVIKFYPHKHLEEFFQFLQKNSEISIFPRYLQAISKIAPFGNRLAGPFSAKRSCETVAKRSYCGDLTVWEMSVF